MYRPLPHPRCTRLLRLLASTPDQADKLFLELATVNLDDVKERSDEDIGAGKLISDDKTDYDALSYTWGSPFSTPKLAEGYTEKHNVLVTITTDRSDRHVAEIGRNLYEALHQIWEIGRRRYLWVDQLCINQNDLVEKEKHVLLMKDIYPKAKIVLVWLGVDDLDLPTLQDVVWLHTAVVEEAEAHEQYSQEPISLQACDSTGAYVPGQVFLTGLNVSIPADCMHSLYRFYARRRYLSRAWILQEVTVHEPLVLIGGVVIPFKNFGKVVKCCADSGFVRTLHYYEPHQETAGHGKELPCLEDLSGELLGRQDVNASPTKYLERLLLEFFGSYDATTRYLALLEYTLSRGHCRRASNPRDVIFSLLGYVQRFSFTSLDEPPVKPNYSASVEDVYLDLTSQLILRLPYRTVLSLVAERDTSSKFACHLPSWVPDFESCLDVFQPLSQEYINLNYNTIPSICAGIESNKYPPLRISDRNLSIHARLCAKIKTVSRPFPRERGNLNDIENCHVTLCTFEELLMVCNNAKRRYPTGEATTEALFGVVTLRKHLLAEERDPSFNQRMANTLVTVCADAVYFTHTHPSDAAELMAGLEQVRSLVADLNGQPCIPTADDMIFIDELACRNRRIRDEDDYFDDDEEFAYFQSRLSGYSEDQASLYSREAYRVFVTDAGYVGRIANDVQPDDELWLICQAKVPFVLRPTNDGNYVLLGEALVHGAMYGELLRNGVAGEAREITIV